MAAAGGRTDKVAATAWRPARRGWYIIGAVAALAIGLLTFGIVSDSPLAAVSFASRIAAIRRSSASGGSLSRSPHRQVRRRAEEITMIGRACNRVLRHFALGLMTLGLAWSYWLPDEGRARHADDAD